MQGLLYAFGIRGFFLGGRGLGFDFDDGFVIMKRGLEV